MSKYRVIVELRARTAVSMDVEATEDEDPTDLTPDDEFRALRLAASLADWEIADVRLVAKRPAETKGDGT